MTNAPDHLALITAALDAASNPRLGTDTRLRHTLTACDHLAKLAAYQERRIDWLLAEVVMLRETGARVS